MLSSRRCSKIHHLEFSSRHLRVLFNWIGSTAAQFVGGKVQMPRCERIQSWEDVCLSQLSHVGMSLGFSVGVKTDFTQSLKVSCVLSSTLNPPPLILLQEAPQLALECVRLLSLGSQGPLFLYSAPCLHLSAISHIYWMRRQKMQLGENRLTT